MRHILAVVPPISKDSTAFSPVRCAMWLAAIAPAAGPILYEANGMADSFFNIGDAASRRHDVQRRVQPCTRDL